jgi:hypothetical protein
MMEKLEHRPDNSFVNVRITLVVIAIVSFPFNLIGIFTANAQIASIIQLVAVSTAISIPFLHDLINPDTIPLAEQLWLVIYYIAPSVPAISSIFKFYRWCESHNQRPFLRNIPHSDILHYTHHFQVRGQACGLCLWQPSMSCLWVSPNSYLSFFSVETNVNRSSLFHAYAVLRAAIDRYKAYLARMSRPKSVALCPACSCQSNYHIMDEDQETGVSVLKMSPELIDAESGPLMGGDSIPFRASEDTAVSLGSEVTVETFDGSSETGRTK